MRGQRMARGGVALMLGALLLQPQAAVAEQRVPLDCQLHNGPWCRCTMLVAADGYHWQVQLEQQAFVFRHDGRGGLLMRQGDRPWRSVEARWRDDSSLCWNGLCAKGPIPLD